MDAINQAEVENYEIAILDDCLQDKSVDCDINLICFNNINWIGNGLTIPAGPLRQDINILKNPFPSLYDIPPYAKKASYYAMPWQILSNCQKETEKEDGFKFTMRANNNPWDKLTFTIYKEPDNKGIMLTLPEFETIMI